MVAGKSPGKLIPRKSHLENSPQENFLLPKIPTWNILTHVFKYIYIFFIIMAVIIGTA